MFRILKDVGVQFSSFQGNILPSCVVSHLGTVSLKVHCNDCIKISKYLSSRLIGSQDLTSISSDETVLVTIGSYHGPQLNSFETWLNGQLTLNSSVFPLFKVEIIELSEEFNNFPHYPVKLVGTSNSRGGTIFTGTVESNALDLDKFGGNKVDGLGELSMGSLKINDYNDERLLTILQQICQGIGGTGIIPNHKSFQGAGLSKVVPSELDKLRGNSMRIFNEIENLLKLVGADIFLKTLDLIANPFSTTLNEELGAIISDSGGVELIPITDISIPIIRGSNAGSGSIVLSACAVDQSIYGYPNHKNTRTPVICYPLEMSLASWNALVGCNTSTRGNMNVPTIKGAIIALNFQAAPFKTIGLSPENGFYFSVPIIWIGAKVITSFKDIVKDGSRILQPIDKSVHNSAQEKKQYSQQNSNFNSPASSSPPTARKSEDDENDKKSNGKGSNWICPNCKLQVFARRSVCFKCHTCRPDQSHPVPRQPPVTSNKPEGDVRDGDWNCHHCNGHNFSSKLACFTCHKMRPGFEDALAVNTATSNGDSGEATRVMPGDWVCPMCRLNNFAKRSRCYKCCYSRI